LRLGANGKNGPNVVDNSINGCLMQIDGAESSKITGKNSCGYSAFFAAGMREKFLNL
jgi:hypothetical protein